MKFDAIVGNPPYQREDGGYKTSAHPIYDEITTQTKKIESDYVSLVIPARWFVGGKGLSVFRSIMLHDQSLLELHDYPVAQDCFEEVQIKGGVCCFLRSSYHQGLCSVTTHIGSYVGLSQKRNLLDYNGDVFIRFSESISIIKKVQKLKEKTMDSIVSSRIPFGIPTYFHGDKEKSDEKLKMYENRGISYVKPDVVKKNKDIVNQYKIFIPRSSDGSDLFPHVVLGIPFIGEPKTVCSETFNFIGPFENKMMCENVMSYISTKFFRFMAMQMKISQSATKKLYSFVPVQNFNEKWSDEKLYSKYKLSKREISFIDSMIRPMDLNRNRKQKYWKDLQNNTRITNL